MKCYLLESANDTTIISNKRLHWKEKVREKYTECQATKTFIKLFIKQTIVPKTSDVYGGNGRDYVHDFDYDFYFDHDDDDGHIHV